jgi:hypothetical protein
LNRYIAALHHAGQAARKKSVRQKPNAIESWNSAQSRTALVDDSIVRGTTRKADYSDGPRWGEPFLFMAPAVRYPERLRYRLRAHELIAHVNHSRMHRELTWR